jgi:condensin complex subunit 2
MDDNVEGPSDDADHNNVPGLGAAPHAFEPFDPRKAPNERDLVLAMTEEGEEMLDYFDATFMKNWAGPEHWKLKRVVRKRTLHLVVALS